MAGACKTEEESWQLLRKKKSSIYEVLASQLEQFSGTKFVVLRIPIYVRTQTQEKSNA